MFLNANKINALCMNALRNSLVLYQSSFSEVKESFPNTHIYTLISINFQSCQMMNYQPKSNC